MHVEGEGQRELPMATLCEEAILYRREAFKLGPIFWEAGAHLIKYENLQKIVITPISS